MSIRPARTTTYDPVIILSVIRRADQVGVPTAAREHGMDPNTVWAWRRKHRDSDGHWPSEEDIRSWHARTDLRASWRQQKVNRLTKGPGTIDPTGTIRRMRALYALGWTWDALGEELGGCKNRAYRIAHGRHTDRGVYRDTEKRVREVYERLSMVRPDGWTADRARRYAQRHGWVPPLAWEGIDIDDPAARPDVGAPDKRGGNGGRSIANLLEDAEWLADSDAALSEVIERLAVNRDTFRETCTRAGRSDLYWRLARREPDGEQRWETSQGIKRSRGAA